MPGTSIYSVLFYAGMLVVLVIAVNYLVGVWRNFGKGVQKTLDESKSAPSWVTPVIKTVLVVTVLIVIFNVGWNVKQSATTHSSKYTNPAETAEKKEVKESQLPSVQEMDRTRVEQKQRSEVKPHKDALDSFDENMKKEAEKIRKRSLGESTSSN